MTATLGSTVMPRKIAFIAERMGALMSVADVVWRTKGACQGLDAEIFYPDNEDHADFAISVCSQCEVRIACLDYALDNREQQGIWGATTARDRRRMLRQRKQTA